VGAERGGRDAANASRRIVRERRLVHEVIRPDAMLDDLLAPRCADRERDRTCAPALEDLAARRYLGIVLLEVGAHEHVVADPRDRLRRSAPSAEQVYRHAVVELVSD